MEKLTRAEDPHPPLSVVVWDDAWSAGIELLTVKEVSEKHHPSVMQTVGWILKKSDIGIWIASERCLDKGEECYRGHTFIPQSLIKSVTPIKVRYENTRRPRRVPAISAESRPDRPEDPR